MAYAVIEKGKIKHFPVLPKSYHSKVSNVLGGFDKLPNEELEKHGFYPVVEPNITDFLFQKKGDLEFNIIEKVFKYRIEERHQPDVVTLKSLKLSEIKIEKTLKLSKTDDIILECLELKKDIPLDISEERLEIRNKINSLTEKVNNLNNQRDLLALIVKI